MITRRQREAQHEGTRDGQGIGRRPMTSGRPSVRETFLFFAAVVLYLLGLGRIWDAVVDRYAGRSSGARPYLPTHGGDSPTASELRTELADQRRKER